MGLITCTECGGKMSTSARFCPHCGSTEISAIRMKKTIIAGCLGFLLFLFLLIGIGLFASMR